MLLGWHLKEKVMACLIFVLLKNLVGYHNRDFLNSQMQAFKFQEVCPTYYLWHYSHCIYPRFECSVYSVLFVNQILEVVIIILVSGIVRGFSSLVDWELVGRNDEFSIFGVSSTFVLCFLSQILYALWEWNDEDSKGV